MGATIPILRYQDATAAIEWLRSALGFETRLLVPGDSVAVNHARLTHGETMIMLASLGRPGKLEALFQTPQTIGCITQGLYIYTADPDAVYEMAVAAGAEIVEEIQDFWLGGRMFTCRDPEGHSWTFGSHDPWAD